MKVKSTELNKLYDFLKNNTKHDFGSLKLGDWSLKVERNHDLAIEIFNWFIPNPFWIQVKRTKTRLLFVDNDVKTNKQWVNIWT